MECVLEISVPVQNGKGECEQQRPSGDVHQEIMKWCNGQNKAYIPDEEDVPQPTHCLQMHVQAKANCLKSIYSLSTALDMRHGDLSIVCPKHKLVEMAGTNGPPEECAVVQMIKGYGVIKNYAVHTEDGVQKCRFLLVLKSPKSKPILIGNFESGLNVRLVDNPKMILKLTPDDVQKYAKSIVKSMLKRGSGPAVNKDSKIQRIDEPKNESDEPDELDCAEYPGHFIEASYDDDKQVGSHQTDTGNLMANEQMDDKEVIDGNELDKPRIEPGAVQQRIGHKIRYEMKLKNQHNSKDLHDNVLDWVKPYKQVYEAVERNKKVNPGQTKIGVDVDFSKFSEMIDTANKLNPYFAPRSIEVSFMLHAYELTLKSDASRNRIGEIVKEWGGAISDGPMRDPENNRIWRLQIVPGEKAVPSEWPDVLEIQIGNSTILNVEESKDILRTFMELSK